MLYVIRKEYFLADFVLQALENVEGIRIISYKRIKVKGIKVFFHSIKKFFRAFVMNSRGVLVTEFFPDRFLNEIQQIKEDDDVLFWGVENLKEILILQKEIESKKISIFLWNPISTINRNVYSRKEYAYYLHRNRLNVYTFDTIDAKQYHFNLVNQVYRKYKYPAELFANVPKVDVFFVGCDKYRSRELADLLDILIQENVSYKFHILRDKHTKIIPILADCITSEKLSYADTLRYVQHSKCIVEILQRGQSGMTMRTLEALFFEKKLITNNKDILNAPFYHPNNIYILGVDRHKRSIVEFLKSECHVFPDELLYPYQIEYWIKQFM